MQKQLAYLLYNAYLDNKMNAKDFVLKVLDIYLAKYDVVDYISDIKFPKRRCTLGSHYDTDSHILVFDIKAEEDFIFNQCEVLNQIDDSNYKEFYRYVLLSELVLHELDHVLLEKEIKEGRNDKFISLSNASEYDLGFRINVISYIKELFKKVSIDMAYQEYHDMVPYERRANIQSLRSINASLAELSNSDLNGNLITSINRIVSNRLLGKEKEFYTLNGSVTNGPSYDFINHIFGVSEEVNELVDVYNLDLVESFNNDSKIYNYDERLLYGLQLSEDELYKTLNKTIK
ncbi:MAG: hypothetical protein J6X02_00315 [Bacilli bacterium]|nr:hypothetical protein [Bacilli bacterium]